MRNFEELAGARFLFRLTPVAAPFHTWRDNPSSTDEKTRGSRPEMGREFFVVFSILHFLWDSTKNEDESVHPIMRALQELISPEQSNFLVICASLALSVVGAGAGFWAAKTRGLVLIFCGPLVWLMWQFHVWITRYDPQSGYFGLNKVWVLALEVAVFVALGAFCGWIWNRVIMPKNRGK